ncbi:hypothetical protein ACFFKU_13100 [Kineococcus gynurae]|uniref:Uridine kinase n=1 Tax=Kineococcus gynurae TaxID=452979 RepID=A0ABV5LQI8_9ACTN
MSEHEPITLYAGEPEAGPFRVVPVADVLDRLGTPPPGRPRVVAVDGRGGSGKSTVARRLAAAAGATTTATVVSTDDVAWHHSFFDWTDLLVEGVLRPARAGRAVAYRPPAWSARWRGGSIGVPAGTRWVFLEGVGSGRRELADLVDAVLWVQSDARAAEHAGIERDVAAGDNGDRDEATRFWHEWQAEEIPFLAEQRPWERAILVLAGVGLPTPPAGELLVAEPPTTTKG